MLSLQCNMLINRLFYTMISEILKPHNIYKSPNMFNCKYFVNCKVCTDKCRIFQPISCKERDRNIGAEFMIGILHTEKTSDLIIFILSTILSFYDIGCCFWGKEKNHPSYLNDF